MEKMIYASFIRYPAEKAHALYVARSCEAFAEKVSDVRLIVPRRFGVLKVDHKDLFGLRTPFRLVRLPCLDLLWLPFGKALAHKVGLLTFGIFVYLYLVLKGDSKTFIFTNDAWVALLASFTRSKVIYEVHDYPSGQWWLYRLVAKRVHRIQTNNQLKVDLVVSDMRVPPEKVYAIHNGVSIEDFDINVSKEDARQRLGLDVNKKYAVYTGHLYDWKGASVLAEAAQYMPEIEVLFIGGTTEDVLSMKKSHGSLENVHFLGHKPHKDIPYYLKAADVLVLPNSGKSDISRYHTSPMKLFEYMASRRPIIASNLPSIVEVLSEKNAILVPPDEREELAAVIKSALRRDTKDVAGRAFADVSQYTWEQRVERIIQNT